MLYSFIGRGAEKALGGMVYRLKVDEFSGLVEKFGHCGDMILADVIGESGLALKTCVTARSFIPFMSLGTHTNSTCKH